jgi:hypothetical protein
VSRPAVSSLGGFRTPAAGPPGVAQSRPASENLVWGLSMSTKKSKRMRVILSRQRLHCGTATPRSAALSGQAPKPCAARRRRGAWRLMRSPSHNNHCRDLQSDFYLGGVPFIGLNGLVSVWIELRNDPRRSSPAGAGIAPRPCIRSIRKDRDHDAVMRIGGEAPGQRAQSAQRLWKPWF